MAEKLKTIKIIHLALCAGLVIAYILVGNVTSINFNLPPLSQSNSVYVLIPIVAYILSNFMFKKQLKNIDRTLKPEANMAAYQTASLIRWAILEGAAFIILLKNKDFVLFGVLIVLYLALIHPTAHRIQSDLS